MGNTLPGKKPATPAGLPRRTKTLSTVLEPIEEVQEATTPRNKDLKIVLRRALSTRGFSEGPPDAKLPPCKAPVPVISYKAGEIIKSVKLVPVVKRKIIPGFMNYCADRDREMKESSPVGDHDSNSTSAFSGREAAAGSKKIIVEDIKNPLSPRSPPPQVKIQQKYGQLARPLKCKQVIVTTLPSHYPIQLKNSQSTTFRIRTIKGNNFRQQLREEDIKPLGGCDKYKKDEEVGCHMKSGRGKIRMLCQYFREPKNLK